jgi:hypothetical protein
VGRADDRGAAAVTGPLPDAAPLRRPRFASYRVVLILIFLAWFAHFYRSGYGFSSVLLFNHARAESRVDSLRHVPVFVHAGAGYDGQFYVQLAADPLLRDSSIDTALDSAPFRARRILFSWTAWVLGLGHPSWIVQAYSVQNVLCWLLLAWWLSRRFPGRDVQDALVWAACLFGPGMLDSTSRALLDGPSLLVIALGIDAIERGRSWMGAIVLGLAGLARETNLIAGVATLPRRPGARALARSAAQALVVLLPMLVWMDYLRSIYRSTVLQSTDQLSAPFVAFGDAWRRMWHAAGVTGWASVDGITFLALAGVSAQAVYLLVRPRWREPWWRVGIAFVGLMLVVKAEIWLGAYLRVLLPLSFAFNLSLPRGPRFWPVFVLGNLGLVSSVYTLIWAWL